MINGGINEASGDQWFVMSAAIQNRSFEACLTSVTRVSEAFPWCDRQPIRLQL
jgi:hypothetical protein